MLQGPHWYFGFGYFPIYALDDEIAEGHFTGLREWLIANVRARGSALTLNGTLDDALREELSVELHLGYLGGKYADLYGFEASSLRR